ncbi:MAG: flagellar basal-body MS-ring/collar protein FliF [Alphaproteobacteria bacterium]|nr:flagellar basal-body MS-ring/collar protein FliF [Alphaproteobacteria bacterium]
MDSLFETLKNLGPGRLAAMIVTFFGLILFFIFITIRSSAPSLTLLYGDMSVSDSTEIAAKLDAANIPYALSENGTRVSVPQKDVGKARILLAQEGLPRSGSVGYEIFDEKQSFGTTSFQQNINQLRALEGELSRTIGTIDQVRNARVHLVLPQRELFSREQRPASASVFLNVRNAAAIGREQIQAIQHLVAASVPQLKPTHVAIIDQNGNLLARGEEEDASGVSARSGIDLRQKYEIRLARAIEDMVGRVVGYGKVRTSISADLNFDILSRNSESYNPDGQVVRSTQSVTEENIDNSSTGNTGVTVENNLPGLPGSAGANGSSIGIQNNRTEETTNFEISKTVESLVRESGEVQRLSIAVLVDGRYEIDTAAEKPEDAGDDWTAPKKYIPRAQDELDKITALVKSAAGFDDSRGDTIEVINMRFADGDVVDIPVNEDHLLFGFPKADILNMAETIALSLVAVLVILLVLRPLASHLAAASRTTDSNLQDEASLLTATQAAPQLAGPGGPAPPVGVGGTAEELESMIDMSSVEGKVKASSLQKISELVTNHPGETVSVIRQWMSQEN